MAIDWTKPIETVPDALNPEPVRCRLIEDISEGEARVEVPVAVTTATAARPVPPGSNWLYLPSGIAWVASCSSDAGAYWPRVRNVAEAALLPDAPPVVLSEAPILLRYHLAQAAMLYEVVAEDTPVGDLVRGLGEPARGAATAWLAAMLAFYDKLDAEEQGE